MAKKALLDVLEQTIGKYVKNLDAESLNVAVWSGRIELNSLQLDIEAVNGELDRQAAEAPNLAVPFKVVSGTFQSFQVDVPWAHLMSQSVILRARGLNVTVAPFDRSSNSDLLKAAAISESDRANTTRKARLQMIKSSDEYRQRTNAMKNIAMSAVEVEPAKGQKKDSSTFGARLVRRIIENIQIEVDDVHVSLQDADGSAGVILKSLSLNTTDVLGKKSFVDRTGAEKLGSLQNSFLYKQLNIDGFSVYLDDASKTSNKYMLAIHEDDASGGGGKAGAPSSSSSHTTHRYILKPLSFQSKLRQADGNVCVDYHKYLLSSELSSIVVDLGRDQMDLARIILQKVQSGGGGRGPLFPEYRPLCRVTKANAKQWWMYAARCIGRLSGRRLWKEFHAAFKLRRRYLPLYKRQQHHKACPWLKELTKDEADEVAEIELTRSISIEGIMSWRNIADAQMEMEKAKHQLKQPTEQKGLFSSLFGSSKVNATSQAQGAGEDPPVTLSAEEMKELEMMNRQQMAEADLSQDSKLCDLKLVLDSLQVNLYAYNLKNIAALNLGSVSTSFSANVDGAFAFDFKISDLGIKDNITPQSLFPSILRRSSYKSEVLGKNDKDAFTFSAAKDQHGDQKLTMKLDAFEATASPKLTREIHAFFLAPHLAPTRNQTLQNPLLAQSLSGSVDLFYDAAPGPSTSIAELPTAGDGRAALLPERQVAKTNDDWANSIVEAWQQKTEKKSTLVVDIDIMAPILVVPESCTHPSGSVLVFDLGRLRLQYGKIDPAPMVKSWWEKNHIVANEDTILDGARLEMSDLKFFVSTVQHWQDQSATGNAAGGSHVINPITLRLDAGVASRLDRSAPLICAFGVVPSVSVGISPKSGSRIVTVVDSWKSLLSDVALESDDDNISSTNGLDTSPLAATPAFQPTSPHESTTGIADPRQTSPSANNAAGANIATIHVALDFEQLAASILDDSNVPQVQTKLISVRTSFTIFSEGNQEGRLQMGYFWVVDRMKYSFVRKQRLIAHSTLPETDLSNKDDISSSLAHLKVKGGRGQSTELADIVFRMNSADGGDGGRRIHESSLHAKFTSLFIHWNPRAMKQLVGAAEAFQELIFDAQASRANNNSVIVPPNINLKRDYERENPPTKSSSSTLRVSAEMKSLDICLNSALDDLPLYIVSLGGTKVDFLSSNNETMTEIQLGMMQVATHNLGQTKAEYQTLLGLMPNESMNILGVRFFTGAMIPETLRASKHIGASTESVAQVDISPVKLVYIQSQILAFTEYITEGILGALTAQAATSATEAAKELAANGAKDKVFLIHADAFDIILPEAATKTEHLSIKVGDVSVCHKILPQPGGANTQIRLQEVSLRDDAGNLLQESPIHANMNVILPDDSVGDKDDQAMKVAVVISDAKFKLSKVQYEGFMSTLGGNFGDPNLYLREKSLIAFTPSSTPADAANKASSDSYTSNDGTGGGGSDSGTASVAQEARGYARHRMSHAGVAVVERTQRLVLTAHIKELSLQLLSEDCSGGLASIAAVDTQIKLMQYPDMLKQCWEVVLRNLICEDQREIAAGRHFRYLMQQRANSNESGTISQEDLFRMKYTTEVGSSDIELFIGTPQITLIPDAIADIAHFFEGPDAQNEWNDSTHSNLDDNGDDNMGQRAFPQFADNKPGSDPYPIQPDGVADTAYIGMSHAKIQSKECSILLVDLGSQLQAKSDSGLDNSRNNNGSNSSSNAGEVIAIEGIFMCNVSTTTDLVTKQQTDAQVEYNGDSVQVYTAFGHDLINPTQVLDPTDLSAHFSMSTTPAGVKLYEVRAATLSHVDVVFSMHDAALLNSILSSLNDFKQGGQSQSTIDTPHAALNLDETKRIEKLAHALESADENDASTVQSQSDDTSVTRSSSMPSVQLSSNEIDTKIQVQLTVSSARMTLVNDLQGLDEALLRVALSNFVTKATTALNLEMMAGIGTDTVASSNTSNGPLLDANLSTSILADYFDPSTGRWTKLLIEPWEISLKANRSQVQRAESSGRLHTVVDLESFPCRLSLSDQFLMSVASSKQLWKIYSQLVEEPNSHIDNTGTGGMPADPTLRRSIVSSVARNLVTSLPYAIDNQTGLDITFTVSGLANRPRVCSHGDLHYFRFDPPRTNGCGGKRQYGQDVSFQKSVKVEVSGETFDITDIDHRLDDSWQSHELGGNAVLFTRVKKFGKTTLLHVTSCVQIKNSTAIPFHISIQNGDYFQNVGLCKSRKSKEGKERMAQATSIDSNNPHVPSSSFSLPASLLGAFSDAYYSEKETSTVIGIIPDLTNTQSRSSETLFGSLSIRPCLQQLKSSSRTKASAIFDIICRNVMGVQSGTNAASSLQPNKSSDPFVLQAFVTHTLVDQKFTSMCIELLPRAVLQNKLPIKVQIRTPMPHIYIEDADNSATAGDIAVVILDQDDRLEIFTPGPSIAVIAKPAESLVGGTGLSWMSGGWIDLPLVSEFQLPEPLGCLFPFVSNQQGQQRSAVALGSECFIVEGFDMLKNLSAMCSTQKFQKEESNGGPLDKRKTVHAFFITTCNYALDHTGDLLFQQVTETEAKRQRNSITRASHALRRTSNAVPNSKPFGAFATEKHQHRLSLLPNAQNSFLQLVKLTMDHAEGMQRSAPFQIEEAPLSSGGLDSLPVLWETGDPSGYFAYRKLINEHQCEVHFIPEFYIYNGNSTTVLIYEANHPEIIVESGKAVPLRVASRPDGVQLAFTFIENGCSTAFLSVNDLGMIVAIVKSREGYSVGSVAIQTAIDTIGNACLVIKIGEMKFGTQVLHSEGNRSNLLRNDFIRYRVRWTALSITLNKKIVTSDEPATTQAMSPNVPTGDLLGFGNIPTDAATTRRSSVIALTGDEPVATVSLNRFTVDYQRIFDDRQKTKASSQSRKSQERTQISLIAHEIQVKDESKNSAYPIVVGCSNKVSFLDLCIRLRGSLSADVIRVDLFDLNLAHVNGSTEKIVLNTDEEFVWKLLDVVHEIGTATEEVGHMVWKIEPDQQHGGYKIRVEQSKGLETTSYTPPTTDQLYSIAHTRVSPFTLLVSFKRNPQASRYRGARGTKGAAMLKYFTQRLKFQIDRAELKFGRYSDRTLRGPPDRLMESLAAVYMSRMKFKIIKILSAASIQDWKYLAARDNGDDEYVEGDILRATGHLSGKTVGYVFKKASRGLGDGISGMTRALGNTIESSSDTVGVGRLGVGVNNVVSGVGDGVGSTISGVGTGVGQVLKGSGQGLGHMVGGVAGGVMMVGKGIGKGIVDADGKAMVDGFKKGGKAIGGGVGQGVESAIMGTADGVMSAGKGLFSGLRSVGKGIGGAVTGKRSSRQDGAQRGRR